MPVTGAGTSALTLSVSTSSIGSNSTTLSPGLTSHLEIVPSWTDSPSCGITTRVVLAISDVQTPSSAAYFAASAAGAKEPTSTRGSASRRCVTERAQEATQASAQPGRLARSTGKTIPGWCTTRLFRGGALIEAAGGGIARPLAHRGDAPVGGYGDERNRASGCEAVVAAQLHVV